MAFDAHKNFAISTVATAPSPATSGTSLVVAAGQGSRFPTVPFNATVWPAGTLPTPANAEIVRVTAISTDTLTITRAQESSSARTIVIGDQIAATITKKTLTDIESQGLRQSFRGLELGTHPDAPSSSIALDAVTNGGISASFSHTCSGTNRLLLVTLHTAASSGVTATYNGVSMNALGSRLSYSSGALYLWVFYLLAPATGSNTVSISGAGSCRTSAISYTGVKQSGFPDAVAYLENQTSSTVTGTVTPTVPGCWMTVVAVQGGSVSSYTNATQRVSNSGNEIFDSNMFVTASSSRTQTLTTTASVSWASAAFSFAPANNDGAYGKVALLSADEIVMHDGESVTGWGGDTGPLVADITASGAGGLDTGSEGASRWYEIYAIRKSTDGTKNLLLHRAKSFDADQSQTTDDGTGSSPGLRYDSTLERLAQSFAAGLSGPLPFIDVKVSKTGTPIGSCWWTLEADSSGSPSGTALATSDKFDVSLMSSSTNVLRVPFRTPYTLVATTTYWLVMRGDYTTSTSNYVVWLQKASGNPYASGTAKTYNGSTWATSTNKDHYFKTYVTQNDTAVTMPSGYDQRALIGYVYNDASSNFRRFRQLNGRVEFNRTQLGTYTNTTLALTDLSAWIPPRTCQWLVAPVTDTANAQLWLGPVPEGYESGYVFYQSLPSAAAGQLGSPLPVVTTYQAIYLAVSTGTGTPRCMGFIWA